MPKAGFKKRTPNYSDPNDPFHWDALGKILDDNGVSFEAFEETSRPELENLEALGWAAVPSQAVIIRADIGGWAGRLSYAYSTTARAKVYEARARAVVKYTLKRKFPKYSSADQVDACSARVVGYRLRWEAVRDSLEEKIRVGKKLIGDEEKERKGN